MHQDVKQVFTALDMSTQAETLHSVFATIGIQSVSSYQQRQKAERYRCSLAGARVGGEGERRGEALHVTVKAPGLQHEITTRNHQ